MLRSLDAFSKPVDAHMTSKSTVGGVITLLASISAGILFLSQIILYTQVQTTQHFKLAESVTSQLLATTNEYYDNMQSNRQPGYKRPTEYQKMMQWQKKELKISIWVVFPHIKCIDLEFSHDGATSNKFDEIHGRHVIKKRVMSRQEALVSQMGRHGSGCSITGDVVVPKVGGHFSIQVTKASFMAAWQFMNFGIRDMNKYPEGRDPPAYHNVSHYIFDLEFGEHFPLATNPLKNRRLPVTNKSGVGLTNTFVKLVPTVYKRFARRAMDTYQMSVTEHFVNPESLASQGSSMLPGLSLTYEFVPLAVVHSEERENFFSFLSSLVSIVGGAFVTVGLVSRFLVNTADIVSKKMD
mmetsp:Transcript_40855/g.47773  ORF Transcript_40855/g.47773 Transcript_40855/m.47773 type:complete len:353 (+) Transcript_40855:63-1121(+)|eukprot:CAMPEP_0194353864 /NCGR_PEP_ID=MMETSP0174-20130528/2083_1 /TAXON_ID=216777 /ORGANISM="Proboscia alata, Strain PI-D3" /LENGTH=352 /DNA_ID=CAMNT_0039122559 /DNA_START=64 /DNA_END=1122 /DNA_ORIENTATION=+